MKNVIKDADRESFEHFSRLVGFVNSVEDWAKRHKLNTYVASYEHKEIKEDIVAEVGKNQSASVFDLGCGYGFFMSRLNQAHPEIFVVGGDISRVQVYNARDRRVNGGLVICCAEYIPIRSDAFDCVVCSEVIEHVVDPKSSLLEMSRILKNRGCLCVTTDNPLSPWRQFIKVVSRLAGLNKGVKEEFLPPGRLLQLLPSSFSVYRIHFTCPYPLLPGVGPLERVSVGKLWILLWRVAGKLPEVGKQFCNKYAVFSTKNEKRL